MQKSPRPLSKTCVIAYMLKNPLLANMNNIVSGIVLPVNLPLCILQRKEPYAINYTYIVK